MSDEDGIDARLPAVADRRLPRYACDTHNHVFGPFQQFPLIHPPDYAVPRAPLPVYLEMLDRVGLDRGVLVQPTQQGLDLTPMLHALNAGGGRLRGVGAADAATTDEQLQQMHAAGVRGLRFVEAASPTGARRPGAVGFQDIAVMAPRMRQLGWSINVWARLPDLMQHLDAVLAPGLPVVFEHMGMLDVARRISDPDFQRMLALLREGRIWIKLSVCRCSTQAPGYADLRPQADALVEANPRHLLWGSDWPFIRMHGREPDAGQLVDLACDWLGEAPLVQSIFVDNPAALYQFGSTSP
ncbi:MAG: amidohydrolase family protein [Gammaproteobacteria bacterium]|nr:amidohydrolase family protein [Gammaproteobacteria bacterium]